VSSEVELFFRIQSFAVGIFLLGLPDEQFQSFLSCCSCNVVFFLLLVEQLTSCILLHNMLHFYRLDEVDLMLTSHKSIYSNTVIQKAALLLLL
jgi:hypothetical protein